MSKDDYRTASYSEHLAVCRKVVEQNQYLHPTAAEISQRRGNYLPLIGLALSEARAQDIVVAKLLLAKLVGELVRGEIK